MSVCLCSNQCMGLRVDEWKFAKKTHSKSFFMGSIRWKCRELHNMKWRGSARYEGKTKKYDNDCVSNDRSDQFVLIFKSHANRLASVPRSIGLCLWHVYVYWTIKWSCDFHIFVITRPFTAWHTLKPTTSVKWNGKCLYIFPRLPYFRSIIRTDMHRTEPRAPNETPLYPALIEFIVPKQRFVALLLWKINLIRWSCQHWTHRQCRVALSTVQSAFFPTPFHVPKLGEKSPAVESHSFPFALRHCSPNMNILNVQLNSACVCVSRSLLFRHMFFISKA